MYAGAPGSSGPAWGGFRWTGLGIPAGATILYAYVELNQWEWGYEVPTTLALEDSASPQAFSAEATPLERWASRTDFQVEWVWPRASPGSWVRTPLLTEAVQELVDRYGAINALVLLEYGSGAVQGRYHQWASYDANPARAARLRVIYAEGAGVE